MTPKRIEPLNTHPDAYVMLRWCPEEGEWWVCYAPEGKKITRINDEPWNAYKAKDYLRAISYAQGKASNYGVKYRGVGPEL